MAAENSQTKDVVDDLQSERRRRWLAGDRVPVEAFLSQHPELASRELDVMELIAAEVRLRQSQGERPDRAEYVGRFPAYASRLAVLFEPKATMASNGGATTRKDTPADLRATATLDPTAGNHSAILATASFDSPLDEGGVDHVACHHFVRSAPHRGQRPLRHGSASRGANMRPKGPSSAVTR